MKEKKHPREFGFEHGLTIRVGGRGDVEITEVSPNAKNVHDVVYVALLADSGHALKIGQTGKTVEWRWRGTIKVMQKRQDQMKPNEWADGEKLLKHSSGRGVEVWFKQAHQIAIPYANVPDQTFTARSTEEDFLDWYYEPLVGQSLGSRKRAESERRRAKRET